MAEPDFEDWPMRLEVDYWLEKQMSRSFEQEGKSERQRDGMGGASASSLSLPRVVVAGLSGDSGKTLISLSIILLARQQGLAVSAFKKGPDYIDSAWLGWGAGRSARQLDTYLMGRERTLQSFSIHAEPKGLNLIEGNRGIYDGLNAQGTHSTAELAKLLQAPVILVANATKTTRTEAALVLGCQNLDPEVDIAGIILNEVSGSRHEKILREAIETVCHVPIVGVLPRGNPDALLPGRHLGLVTPFEHSQIDLLSQNVLSLCEDHIDLDRIMEIAQRAPVLPQPYREPEPLNSSEGLRIGYLKDSAFTFYYPENLEAIERSGANLRHFSALSADRLPDELDALYIGGGFPETHAAAISENESFLQSLRLRAKSGLPIYAECGGLMLLAQAMHWKGVRYPMAGVLPVEVEMCSTPQGHGYVELEVDRPNAFFTAGYKLRGHEFHYSRVICDGELPATCCTVKRGTGLGLGRDALISENVWASYTHLHATGTAEWSAGFLAAAHRYFLRKSAPQFPLTPTEALLTAV
jgi:cobyrinic acid a,c-diamide synthase